jgi:energy-coupling factor transporter ATP-binding protein EcfA2
MSAPTEHMFFRRVRLVSHGPHFSLELRPGIHSVVVESDEAAQAFVSSAAGISLPSRGTIRIGRRSPGDAPDLRGRIGSLLPNEPPLLRKKSVRDHVEYVLAIRRELSIASAQGVEGVPLIEGLLNRPPESLSATERRKIALGLALALEKPVALILFDPLSGLDDDESTEVLDLTRDEERASTITLFVTPSERLGARLSDRVHHLFPRRAPGVDTTYFLVRSERPRELAGYLAAIPEILGTRLQPHIEGQLVVEAADEASGALAITDVVCRSGVDVFEMRKIAKTTGVLES